MATTYSFVGLRDSVIALLTADTSAGVTYGAVSAPFQSINLELSPASTDPDVQYADDVESDVMYPDPEYNGTLEIKELPLATQAALLGMSVDSHGVLVEKAGATPAYFAIGFKAETRKAGRDLYCWLLKCRAKPVSQTFHTKEGKTQTRQTGKLEFTAIKRTFDGEVKHTVYSDDAAFASSKSTFFSAPYTSSLVPAITISAQPADTAVTEGAITGTLAVTASVTGEGSLTYQWYSNTTRSAEGGTALTGTGATTATLTIPTGLADGNHYFYCVVSSTGAVSVTSDVVVVVVLPAA